MSEIAKIKRYIGRTRISGNDRFYMNLIEAMELVHMAQNSAVPADAIALAFDYGKAKGYRAAKAEARMK